MYDESFFLKIKEKLGFDPRFDDYEIPEFESEDDSWKSPLEKLSEDELEAVYEYKKAHKMFAWQSNPTRQN